MSATAWMVLAGVMLLFLLATIGVVSAIRAMHHDMFDWLRSIDRLLKTVHESAIGRSELAGRDEGLASEVASRLSSISVGLERLSYLGGSRPYPFDYLAVLRARCHYMWWRIKRNDQVSGDVRWRVLEEDEAQYKFLYSYLTLAMAANQRVSVGVETIPEAIARVESEKGHSPFDDAERGYEANAWDIAALREFLTSYGLNMDQPVPPPFR